MQPNDELLSNIGFGSPTFFPRLMPAVAYNTIHNEVLAVWNNHRGDLGFVPVDLSTGMNAGPPLITASDVSANEVGPAGVVDLLFDPSTALYYVVWQQRAGSVSPYQRIRLCELTAAGSMVQCSSVFDDDGGPFTPPTNGRRPSAVLNPIEGEILVAFQHEHNCMAVRDISVSGFGGGGSFVTCLGAASNVEARPALAYNSTDNEYLMVWHDQRVVEGVLQFQIFARLLEGTDGDPILGSPEFRISDAGLLESGIAATFPDVTYNPASNEYLVVWTSDDTDAGLVDGEQEIFAQRLSANGSEIGINDQRVTFVSGTGIAAWDAVEPKVDWDPYSGNYLLTWQADDQDFGLANNEAEVFVAMLDGATATPRSGAVRISDMGPDGDTDYQAQTPIAVVTGGGRALVAWWGQDTLSQQIFAQRVEIGFFQDGFESGDFNSWSSSP